MRLSVVAGASTLLSFSFQAEAAAPARVGILGPAESPMVLRLERNVTAMKMDAENAIITVCSRDVVSRLADVLRADSVLCTDGDQIGVWIREGHGIVLKSAIVTPDSDERANELAAARATMALTEATPGAPTVSVGGDGPSDGVSFTSTPRAQPEVAPTKDAPATTIPKAPKRVAPRLVLGAGPAIAASRGGNALALSVEAEIGVANRLAIVPWMQFIPANRTVDAPSGSASFRPTLFGVSALVPLLDPSSVVVPRLGAGYAILWMHVSPESAASGSQMRAPEDLLAPVLYATGALSFATSKLFRLAVEGMAGVSSHDMVVRIGGQSAAHWGVPVASLALRGEWVIP